MMNASFFASDNYEVSDVSARRTYVHHTFDYTDSVLTVISLRTHDPSNCLRLVSLLTIDTTRDAILSRVTCEDPQRNGKG